MSKHKFEMREGFWYSENEPDLPMPKEREKPWKGSKEFRTALSKIQASGLCVKLRYKGSSRCRICDEPNGSSEFVYDHKGIKLTWPDGYMHYIKVHNVKPNEMFRLLILQVAEELD